MKILVFTEGTILMHQLGRNVDREERVRHSYEAGTQREERTLSDQSSNKLPKVAQGSVYDFSSYIPIGNAVEKLENWKQQGANIYYLTSRRIKSEIDMIQNLLQKYLFPDAQNLFFRKQGEDYKDVAERIIPDILIEDDCESIGGEKEMTYPHIQQNLKKKIKSIVVKEFAGIDSLSNDVAAYK